MSLPFLRYVLRIACVGLVAGCAASGADHGSPAGDDSGASTDGSPSNTQGGDASSGGGQQDTGSGSGSGGGSGGGGSPDATSSQDATSGGPVDGGHPETSTGDEAAAEAAVATEGGIGGANAAIHDDFESGSLSKWTVTDPFGGTLQSPATLAIDTTKAHSGMDSVKIHNGGVIGVAPPASAFYGRFWVWLATNPSPGRGSGGHWGWVMAPGTSPDGGMAEIRQGGQFDILIDNDSVGDDIVLSDPNLFNDTDGGVTPPIAQWICVEFFYGKDSLRTWLQGTEISALDVTPTTVWAHGMTAPWSPAYSAIRIGYAGYNGNQIDLWIDDVAIDANRIGCN